MLIIYQCYSSTRVVLNHGLPFGYSKRSAAGLQVAGFVVRVPLRHSDVGAPATGVDAVQTSSSDYSAKVTFGVVSLKKAHSKPAG